MEDTKHRIVAAAFLVSLLGCASAQAATDRSQDSWPGSEALTRFEEVLLDARSARPLIVCWERDADEYGSGPQPELAPEVTYRIFRDHIERGVRRADGIVEIERALARAAINDDLPEHGRLTASFAGGQLSADFQRQRFELTIDGKPRPGFLCRRLRNAGGEDVHEK